MNKLVFEAMERLRWFAFVQSLSDGDENRLLGNTLTSEHTALRAAVTPDGFNKFVDSASFEELHIAYQSFCQSLTTPMAVFWNSYIQMVGTLLCLIRSTREGNWALHMQCIHHTIPWMFAYDRLNYAKYLPVYEHQMCSLPVTHPEAYTSISNGEFGLQRGSKPFSQVPRDQAIEQTLNKTTKTHGGIIEFSRNIQAVHRWTITAHERDSLREKCFSMAGLKPHHTEEHQESSSTRLNKDEEDVRNVVGFVESLGNPFIRSP